MQGASRPGTMLPDRYEDLGVIGQGGMGEVRRVRDRRLDCTLAMKLLSPALVDRDSARWRFLREVKVTARLRHPSIVAVQDYGELADGRLWFTMTEVAGRTLRQVLAEDGGDLASRARAVGILRRVCEAVASAHASGVGAPGSQARQHHGRALRRGHGHGLGASHGCSTRPLPAR